MSPQWSVFLLITLAAIWLICRNNWATWRELYCTSSLQDMYEIVLFAILGYYATRFGVVFLDILRQPTEVFTILTTLILLVAVYRFRLL